MSPGVETNGRPNPCSDVLIQRTARSPNGREPQGDGASIVARVRENRTHGEGGQVDRSERSKVDVMSRAELQRIWPLESRVLGNRAPRNAVLNP